VRCVAVTGGSRDRVLTLARPAAARPARAAKRDIDDGGSGISSTEQPPTDAAGGYGLAFAILAAMVVGVVAWALIAS